MSAEETPKTDSEKTVFLNALLAVQTELRAGIVKDSTNPHFKNQYADRTSLLQFVLPIINNHGFVLTQNPVPPPVGLTDVLALNTTLYHAPTGASIGETAVVPLPKSDPQGFGSALTYTSRYAIVSLFALPLLSDDDGNAGSNVGSGKSGAAAFKHPEKATPAKKADPKKPTADAAKPAAPVADAPPVTEAPAETTAPVAQTKATTASLWGKK